MGSKQRFNFTIQVDDVDEGTSECVVLQIHYHKQQLWKRKAKQFILAVKKGAKIVFGAMEGASHPEPPELPETPEYSEPPELPETPEYSEPPELPETPKHSESPELPETPKHSEPPETPKHSKPPENSKSPYLCWEGFHKHTPEVDSKGADFLFM
ncbi:uncharacterized protein LOC106180736 [Lingula anatina]|uniref:Uncharacterized protein LOC106180736 n=1 Tax=Lingula anatina TaxID=7574 RepID=A0A1S3KCC4_LINAN|nr:uncharacterized protein LOC106180736 [Lingula anatina]|eukprot:XP_013420285.1 uncharacterized protein LOC106180736 [Lingula anatina]